MPHLANELWWEVIGRLPRLSDRMRMAQVCHRFHSLVCSHLRFLDLSSSGAHHHHHHADCDSAAQQQPSTKLAQLAEGLDRFLQHLGRNCHNLRGLVLPPKVTSGVHLERVAGMKGLTSLSLYGCSAVSDDDLAVLARSPSLAASLRLLLLCGTNITDAGLKHLAAFTGLERLHACGTYTTLEGLACLPSPARETAVVHQEHSLFIFPGMTEALSMQRKGISYNPFSLFSTSLIPSIHKNVRRMHETIAWLEKRQMVLDRRIRDKDHYAKHYIRLNEREKAMAALRRKKMYMRQRDRIDAAGRQLADSLLAFQIVHDLGLIRSRWWG